MPKRRNSAPPADEWPEKSETHSSRCNGSFAAILTLVLGAFGLMGPISPVHATAIPVLTNSDTVADDGACSLREAIAAANMDAASASTPGGCPAGSGKDTITVPAMVISLGSRLEIGSPMDLIGSGVGATVVEGGGQAVFLVSAGQVTLRGLIVQRGTRGILVSAGTVEISGARITGNSVTGGGGGLFVASGATVTVRQTTIDGNRGAGAGNGGAGGIANQGTLVVHESLVAGNGSNRTGGIWNGPGAKLDLRNTTVSGNEGDSPTAGAGGLVNIGFAVLNNVTITENRGRGNNPGSFLGGGLLSSSGAATVVLNSIIANNDGRGGPNDCAGALSSDSRFNLLEDTAGCQLPDATDTFLLGQDPKLGRLENNGGPTRTHLPDSDSPVVDAGSPSPFPPVGPACEPIDQRGVPRLLCDMGAVELEVLVPTELSVTTTADEVDVTPGDATCATASSTCSLRAAVQEANRLPGSQTITVPAGIYDLSIPPGDEGGFDPAAGGDLDLLDRDGVIALGANRRAVIVDGNDLSRIFDVAPGATATIFSMTIRDGTDLVGGGVRVTSGSLTLQNVIVEDNESALRGGGIFGGIVVGGGPDPVLNIRNSIIRNNRAIAGLGGNGGGIDADGQITINRTRIIGNETSNRGGGLRVESGAVSVIKSTIAGNKAAGGLFLQGGGIHASNLNLVESTVSGNTADTEGGGVFASGGSIVNSTVSGNTSGTNGGGVSTSGTLSLLHVTIAANKAAGGGNALLRFGISSELSLQNTILANPSSTECAGLPPASRGNNIASDTSCGLRAGGDKQATNARIGPLRNNGGLTRTHMLQITPIRSPAIDAAANVGLIGDQRGVRRPQGPRPDIGSVERGRN